MAMGIVCMGGKDGEMIQSVGQMVGKFTGELYPKLAMWEKQLMQSPESLESIEHEVKAAFLHGAGMITSGLIAVVLLSKDLEHKSERTRREFDYPLARGRNRDIRVRLLGVSVQSPGCSQALAAGLLRVAATRATSSTDDALGASRR